MLESSLRLFPHFRLKFYWLKWLQLGRQYGRAKRRPVNLDRKQSSELDSVGWKTLAMTVEIIRAFQIVRFYHILLSMLHGPCNILIKDGERF